MEKDMKTNKDLFENLEDIPVKKNMPIQLRKTTASGYPVPQLKKQLTDLGLACEETSEEELKRHMDAVMQSFKTGKRRSFGIYSGRNVHTVDENMLLDANGLLKLRGEDFLNALGISATDVSTSWTIDDDAGGYRETLCTIVYGKNFDYLKSTYPDIFAGVKSKKDKTINEPTGEAIRKTFEEMANAVCQVVQSGIQEDDLKTMVSKILGTNTSTNPHDYQRADTLYVYLVSGYEEGDTKAVAVGVLSMEYSIYIRDYNDKAHNKDNRHNDADISITARFISYSDLEPMNRDLAYIRSKSLSFPAAEQSNYLVRGNCLEFVDDIPIPKKKLTVHTKKPVANADTFRTGMPIMNTGNYADTMIFFCPDFENVGYIDNTESDVTTSYSKTVTVGFENSTGITISAETSMELDFQVAKMGFKMGVSMSMTNTWNSSQSETVSFELAGGKAAFLYQAKLQCVVLRFDPATNSYDYVNHTLNRFLSDSLKTTKTPIMQE